MSLANVLNTVLPLLWAGMVLGVCFHDAPTKFKTPTLDRKTALEVGALLFWSFNRIELIFAFFTLNVYLLSQFSTLQGRLLLIVYSILTFEVGSLQPLLDERVGLIIADKEVSKADFKHTLYILLEFTKVTSLVIFVVLHLIG